MTGSGVGPTVDVDAAVHHAIAGDRLLLCSDGLFNELDEEQIRSLLGSNDLSSAADTLVAQAMANGGHDNITVVVAEVSA